MRVPLSVLSVLLVLCAVPAAAQEFPAFYVRGELGGGEIHSESGLRSPWGGVKVGRAFGQGGVFALDVGVAGGSSDGGFGTATAGIELRAFARDAVSPFVRLEAGWMNDSFGPCGVGGLGGGLSFRVKPAMSVRGGVLVCAHCGDGSGPVVAFIGLEYRW